MIYLMWSTESEQVISELVAASAVPRLFSERLNVFRLCSFFFPDKVKIPTT